MNIKIALCGAALLATITSFAQNNIKPLEIGKTIALYSDILSEDRVINVALPTDYDPTAEQPYPVVYILDGGVDEDFIHLAGLVRFNSQPWIARFPNSIVVGIETVNRRRDMTFAVDNLDFVEKVGYSKDMFVEYGRAEAYTAFLESEVIPYVEQNFHASDKRTVIGESLAGLYSTYVLLKHPYLFQNYIIISPSLWWGEGRLLTKDYLCLLDRITDDINVYVGAPSKEEDEMMYQYAVELYESLQKNNYIKSHFDYLPDELHSTVIHQAVNNAFRMIYSKTYFSK